MVTLNVNRRKSWPLLTNLYGFQVRRLIGYVRKDGDSFDQFFLKGGCKNGREI